MRQLWMGVHLIGMIAWMGGTWAALLLAPPGGARTALGAAVRQQTVLYRVLVAPGAMLTVLSGLVLTLSMYGGATSVGGLPRPLMAMQLAGLAGGIVALVGVLPTATRLARIDPLGEYAAAFDRLYARLRAWAFVSAALAIVALIAGAMS